jgi:hypothetical protein
LPSWPRRDQVIRRRIRFNPTLWPREIRPIGAPSKPSRGCPAPLHAPRLRSNILTATSCT